VASVIGAFIAMVAVSALRVASAGAERIDANIDRASEVRFAAELIQRDLQNLYRTGNNEDRRLVGLTQETVGQPVSRLIMWSVGWTKARPYQPERDVYEVEYFVRESEQSGEALLMRRLWPNPDKEAEPGGVVTAVARNIRAFQVRFFDGQQWQWQWPEELGYMPELVEVAVAGGDAENKVVSRRFIVNFARAVWAGGVSPGGEEAIEEGVGEGR